MSRSLYKPAQEVRYLDFVTMAGATNAMLTALAVLAVVVAPGVRAIDVDVITEYGPITGIRRDNVTVRPSPCGLG